MRQRIAALVAIVALPAVAVWVAPPAPGPALVAQVSAAPTAALAFVAAHRQGSRVEVVDQRTETRTVYANPDGTMTAEIAALALQAGHFEARGSITLGWSNPNQGIPNGRFWNRSPAPDSPGWAQVGQCYRDRDDDRCGEAADGQFYIHFDTSFVNNADILEAHIDTEVMYSPSTAVFPHQLWWTDDFNEQTTWNVHPNDLGLIDTRTAPAAREASAPMAFAVNGNLQRHGVSAYAIRAADHQQQLAWRKYDPAQTILKVTYNNHPNRPANARTDPPLSPCRWCAGIPYVGDSSIRIIATVSDPDSNLVAPQWRVQTNGTVEAWNGPEVISGATTDAQIDLAGKPDGARVDWWVHATDGAASSDMTSGPYPLILDHVGVNVAPVVSAALYRQDNSWHGGTSVPDVFTFTADSVADIDHYLWDWTDQPSEGNRVDAEALGGKASVTLTPLGDGPRTLFVQSVDRAGHRSPVATYRFYVRAGSGPYAQWAFDGNAKDSAFLGDRDGTLQGAASYVPGALGNAVAFDGTGKMVARNVVHTDASFSVSAWARLDRVDDAFHAVVRQYHATGAGFGLEYQGNTKQWTFVLPNADQATAWYAIKAPQPPVAGEWTHLTGTYDGLTKQISFYVNGVLAGTTTRGNVWDATGRVEVGTDWPGSVDEVQLYDRVLSPAEVRALVVKDNVQRGYWRFEDKNGSTSVNSIEGGEDLVLTGGATFVDGGAVGRAAHFDNSNTGQAATTGPVVRTDQSFSVTAWVKADEFVGGGAAMTAVSQDGTQNSGFYLQYSDAAKHWVFLKVTTDDQGSSWVGAIATQAPKLRDWVHLAGVYDATNRRVSIYVDGEFQAAATLPVAAWSANGPLVIGRAKLVGRETDFWHGSVDEVRLYSRVLDPAEIRGIMSQNNVTVGSWKFDDPDLADSSPTPHVTTKEGNPTRVAGQTSVPNTTDLAIHLDGANDYLHAQRSIDTTQSFAVSAWVKPDKPGVAGAVVTQDAQHLSGFSLSAGDDGLWRFFAPSADSAAPAGDWAVGSRVQFGVWTHLVGVYSRERQRLELYVNGVLAGSVAHIALVAAPGELQIGRLRWADGYRNHFAGAIDDVNVYGRPLFAEEIATLAGRDLTLVHNWQLDEGSGTVSADSVGARALTLSGGASYGPGELANAVMFNGSTGFASTTGVDLRTDQSFTVAAWVYTEETACSARVCRSDAVTVDGGQTSKFRLGRRQEDGGGNGNWQFEMPRQNGTVMTAAVSVDTSDIGRWVHLVGVYDAPAKKIWLYVDGIRIGDGTLDTPWQAAGPLQLGRGLAAGAPAEYWKGGIDEVRLYTGALDADRITALYDSYAEAPKPATLPVADAGRWTFDEHTGSTAADSSGRNHPATLRGTAGWNNGRTGGTSWLNGTTDYADTDTQVLTTDASFTVSAWVHLTSGTGNRVVVSQDGASASAFSVQYSQSTGKWVATVATADPAKPVLVPSANPAILGLWTQVAMVYDKAIHQVRLYVNGSLAGIAVGVSVPVSTGRFAIGRGRTNGANSGFLAGGVDDVRSYGRPLSAGELAKVHDDVPLATWGTWPFEGKPDDTSWQHNPTTLTGTASYVVGKVGKAVQLTGSGYLTTQILGANTTDSFTVSAWVKLADTSADYTVLGQDGAHTSGFVLQYNKNVGRWTFGEADADADGARVLYAFSSQPPAVGAWTHLAGVYDYPNRQLRLYVDGVLVGIRDNAPIPLTHNGLSIGRGLANGAPAALFNGAIDEVQADLGAASDDEIRRRAGVAQ